MTQEFDTLQGTVHGLLAAISAIAATLPDEASVDAAQTLLEMTSDVSAAVGPGAAKALQAVVEQVVDALQTPLRQNA